MRQRRNDVIDHSISKVILLWITAHVRERQNSDGRFIRKSKGGLRFWRNCRFRFLRARNREHLHRSRDVLERDLALVVETHIDPVTDLIMNSTRDRNASRDSDAFEPRCNIDAITEDIVVVDDDVSQMDADAELDPLGLRYLRVLVSHAALNFDGASRCIDGTGKFDEHAIASGLDDAAAMFGDCGVDKRFFESLQLRQRAFLVGTNQAAITGDIRRQDSCQSPLYGLAAQDAPPVSGKLSAYASTKGGAMSGYT